MKKKVILSIVIPVYNESENIKKTLLSLRKHIKTPHEIIVIYDEDSDTTLPVLKKVRERFRNLKIYKNQIAKGPSGAIRTGFGKSSGNLLLVTMADLCDDITQVDYMVGLAKNADVVCPSRYCKGGGQIVHSKYKAIFPQTAGFFLHLLTGITTKDPTNSFKLYSAKFVQSLDLKSTVSFSVTLEIMSKAHVLSKKIIEVPTTWHDRQFGKTNFKIIPSIINYMPWFVLALLKNRLFQVPEKTFRRYL